MREKRSIAGTALTSGEKAQDMDAEAADEWGLGTFALVEAAGRACADVFISAFLKENKQKKTYTALAGSGNNAADALVMLRALILSGCAQPSACSVFLSREPVENNRTPQAMSLLSVKKLGVAVTVWDGKSAFDDTDVIIDGIAGTGLNGPLRGPAISMTEAANSLRRKNGGPLVVSVDIPSGNFDGWQPGMPIIAAHATLAIEPQKLCLYTPPARPHAGTILPVGRIFPPALLEKYQDAELVGWEDAAARIPGIPSTAHKYERGLVEIRAGSPGAAGAARLAAMGAQAAGAGLVRLIVDPSLYAVAAPACTGIMVTPDGMPRRDEENRFSPTAALLGPGWGKGEDRERLLAAYLPEEERGLPLILDADAIALAKGIAFNGNAILTPHPGEFAAYTGLPKESILANPVPVLRRFASEKKAVILFKGHVLYAVAPDGRVGVIDGMTPILAAGGSGDVLAGFCAAIAARMARQGDSFDGYACACAAASLLVWAAHSIGSRFSDPAEIAQAAAAIAGAAWLPQQGKP